MKMIINLYSIYDKKAEAFSEPFTAVNDEVAKRNFRYTMSRYSDYFVADMLLYQVGTFSSDLGLLTPINLDVVDSGVQILADIKSEEELNNEKIEE